MERQRSGDAEPAVSVESHSRISAQQLFSLCISCFSFCRVNLRASVCKCDRGKTGMGGWERGLSEPCVTFKYKSSVKGRTGT